MRHIKVKPFALVLAFGQVLGKFHIYINPSLVVVKSEALVSLRPEGPFLDGLLRRICVAFVASPPFPLSILFSLYLLIKGYVDNFRHVFWRCVGG